MDTKDLFKTVIASLTIAVIFAACSKDDDSDPGKLDIKKLSELIDKTPEQVKSTFAEGTLESETSALGKPSLKFSLHTEESDYSITFNGNTDGVISSISITGRLKGDYSEDVERFKSMMDELNGSIKFETYIARYYSSVLIDFDDRGDFWSYVAEKDVNQSIHEIWWLENTVDVKFIIDCSYSRASNIVNIEIKKTVWVL